MKKNILFLIILALSANIALAKTTALFSPQDDIKARIIKNINLCRQSVKVVVSKIESEELAEALITAKEKGIKVKIITSLKEATKEDSQTTRLIKERIEVKLMKGIDNNFVLFDDQALCVGSYLWTSQSPKNHHNALFTNEPSLVKPFRKEFTRLLEK